MWVNHGAGVGNVGRAQDFPVLVIFSPGFCDGSSATISTARPGLDFAVDFSSRSVR